MSGSDPRHEGRDAVPADVPPDVPGDVSPPRAATAAPTRRGALSPGRLPIIVVVVAVIVILALLGTPAPARGPGPTARPTPQVALSGAQSASWYCLGGTGVSKHDQWDVVATNVGATATTGTIRVANTRGEASLAAFSVPPHGIATVDPRSILPGQWGAAQVVLAGGDVSVSQAAHGAAGWSMVPCSTQVASSWYLPAGSTTSGSSLETVVSNPTATPAVVNLTYITASGVVQPQPFQGLVVAPGGVVAVDVGTLVQDQKSVATIVTAKSGRVVAGALLETRTSKARGLVTMAGSTTPEHELALPSTTDPAGGTTMISILNPSSRSSMVTVHVELPSGPVAPLQATVAPDSTWQLELSSQTRIPPSEPYTCRISATGDGVVAARTVQAPASASGPRLGLLSALAVPSPGDGSRWFVPAPGAATGPLVGGAAVQSVAIANPGSTGAVSASVYQVTPTGLAPVAHGSRLEIGAARFVDFDLIETAPTAYVVQASDPVVVSADLVPAGAAGVVSTPGVPFP